MARECGYRAEVISADELRWARGSRLRRRARSSTTARSRSPRRPETASASSSPTAWKRSRATCARGVAHVVGVRLRPRCSTRGSACRSRTTPRWSRASRARPPGTPLAVSFHARREDFHGASWSDVAGDVARPRRRAAARDGSRGRRVRRRRRLDARGVRCRVRDATCAGSSSGSSPRCPRCTELIFEPGQAVCTPCEALVARVVEVRDRGARREAIARRRLSGLAADARVHAPDVRRGADGTWRAVGRGPDRVGGRTCLEYDLIDGVRLPDGLAEGDRFLIAGTGSYDRSMAFDFARGEP